MINFDVITKENNGQHNLNSQNIPDHPYRMLIIGGSTTLFINYYVIPSTSFKHKIYKSNSLS